MTGRGPIGGFCLIVSLLIPILISSRGFRVPHFLALGIFAFISVDRVVNRVASECRSRVLTPLIVGHFFIRKPNGRSLLAEMPYVYRSLTMRKVIIVIYESIMSTDKDGSSHLTFPLNTAENL